MKYRLLACDLDDTVFGGDLVITPRTAQAFAALKEKGVQVCINTGRFYSSALPHAKRLGLTGLMGLCQGAAVVDPLTREHIAAAPLPQQTAARLLRYAREAGLTAQFYNDDDYFRNVKNQYTQLYDNLAQHTGVLLDGDRPLEDQLTFDPLKVLFVAEPDVVRRHYDRLRAELAGVAEVTISRPTYLEFNAPAATKGNALRAMAAYYGVDMCETAAIGDGLNDVSMLQAAGLGIAMGNAADAVKAAADAVTAPQAQDGFAQAVERYLLEG